MDCLEYGSASLVIGKGPLHKEQVEQKPIGSKGTGHAGLRGAERAFRVVLVQKCWPCYGFPREHQNVSCQLQIHSLLFCGRGRCSVLSVEGAGETLSSEAFSCSLGVFSGTKIRQEKWLL